MMPQPFTKPGDSQLAKSADTSALVPVRARAAAPLPIDPVLIAAGAGIAAKSVRRRLFGWKRHPGDAQAICRAVIEDCWNGDFFAGSAGHFSQFWTRDLALCTPALCRLGDRDRVIASWTWGLQRFARARRITTTIFSRRPRDVYAYGSDSLPLLLYGLREAGAMDLVRQHRDFLADECQRFVDQIFDPTTGMARASGYFSGPRDCMTGRSTVFANTMLVLYQRMVEQSDGLLPNLLEGRDIRAQLMAHHWMGDYFRDSLCRMIPSGDANVWPFFFGVFDDPEMMGRALDTLEARGFTQPIPLRYFERRLPESELPIPRFFTPNYQGDPSWTQLGPAFLKVLAKHDQGRMTAHRDRMATFIERDGNYLELYTTQGQPYRGRGWFYFADEGMLWAAMFLDLY